MTTCKIVSCAALFFGSIALAQPIPTYRDEYDYCEKNPHAVTCRDGKPINVMEEMQKNAAAMGLTTTIPTTPARATPARVVPRSTRVAPRSVSSASPSVIQVGALDWRFVHPHAELLIGMDLENLLGSELMRTLLRDWAAKLGATPAEQEKMMAGLGTAKRILISISNKDMLAMMVGNIGNLTDGAGPQGVRVTRLSADTALMGTAGGTAGALTRMKLAAAPNAQQDEAKLMASTYDFWVWGRTDRLAGINGGARANSTVSKIKLGVSFRDGFNLQMILDTPDPSAAARLFEGMQKGAPRGMTGAVEGNSVRYAMALDRDAALQRFGGFMTDSIGKQFAPLIAAARQMSAGQAGATARPSAGKIVIDGLEDGPKEIPVSQR